MFTGIIEEVAKVENIIKSDDFIILDIVSTISNELNIGDSVSVNGVCLTVTETNKEYFRVNIIKETLNTTSLKEIDRYNSYVNIERPLKLSSRIDGHILQGHIEATVPIVSKRISDKQVNYTVEVGKDFSKYCIKKGSIALDGISLTIANISKNMIRLESKNIDVAIIPHTLENTTLKYKEIGDILNLETDMFAKYVENIINTK